ncbi:hypothetical protein B2G71_13675 [Novosphingobium sp. PC22D]|uniref:hypothetical protein n=1 Tax=Novosphingobium sp. PC22D TaxID=1962403 RepID=UPI000BEF5AEA|nr:hypothetical protein [Novosphingobium sp. PC22D]PEQ12180.1 hypothetical protein B2G71_13675 [Novosphingobium sp. PC22D]
MALPIVSQLRAFAAVGALVPLLAACVSAPSGPPRSPREAAVGPARQPVRPPVQSGAREPVFRMEPGLEGVIGASVGDLTRLFGTPRLDVHEGDARKLQFTGTACLLDIYLYPSSRSREPLATYVDARRASDGQDVDKGACVAALRRR